MKFGVGQSVRRVEDQRLLTGTGRYTDDISLPRQTHAYFLRSPHAHARLTKIDAAAARTAPGVVGVVTGADSRRRASARFRAWCPCATATARR